MNHLVSLIHQSGRSLMRKFGTSYFWATLLLPRAVQHTTVELYKFVRIPDQIVDSVEGLDNTIKTQQLTALITQWQSAYRRGDITNQEFGAWISIMQDKQIKPEYVDSFFAAMKDDLVCVRYATYDQLKEYMYGSAEVVGLIMTDLIGYDSTYKDVTLTGARKLGKAMQLTNFLRDVSEDCIDLGRIYMPADLLAKYHLKFEDVNYFAHTKSIDHRRIAYMKHMIKVCDLMYEEANMTVQYLTPSCQSAILVASDLYREILRKLESIEYNQFAYSARTTRRDKMVVIAKRQLLCKIIIICIKGYNNKE